MSFYDEKKKSNVIKTNEIFIFWKKYNNKINFICNLMHKFVCN